jgi:predicted RNA-binding protein with PIN domain
MKSIVDGYNLLYACYTGYSPAHPQALGVLIDRLAKYKRIKSTNITVVLDGTRGIHQSSQNITEKGIRIIYTARGRTADEEIVCMVKGKGDNVVVVSSDRSIKYDVEKQGAVCVDSDFFAKKLNDAFIKDVKGAGEDEETYREQPKKGPSKRMKKKVRKQNKIIPKL